MQLAQTRVGNYEKNLSVPERDRATISSSSAVYYIARVTHFDHAATEAASTFFEHATYIGDHYRIIKSYGDKGGQSSNPGRMYTAFTTKGSKITLNYSVTMVAAAGHTT
uniref:Uncharacterized protein n=1 Tax=Timema poppense TaxID=170557 RepID=A0A7R9DKP2_TIMPO|nr:unnamed protein product [Timema poppensis]